MLFRSEVDIRFGASGEAAIHALCGPSGQGHETVYPEVMAQIVGVDPERITLRAGDPDGPPLVGEGTIGSRSMMAHGGAIAVAAREIVRKAQELAARDLEVSSQDIDFKDGVFSVKGTDLSVTMTQIMKKHGISQLPVLDGGKLIGIISEGDLVDALLKDPENIERPISGLVDQNYVVVPPDTPVARLAAIFSEGKVALIEEGGLVRGLVTKIDFIDHMAAKMR